jgi:hypothetical protein
MDEELYFNEELWDGFRPEDQPEKVNELNREELDNIKVEVNLTVEWREQVIISKWAHDIMNGENGNPMNVPPHKLWALLKTKYRDGDEFVDGEGKIWDVWVKSNNGFAIYCPETKQELEVPKPEKLGG